MKWAANLREETSLSQNKNALTGRGRMVQGILAARLPGFLLQAQQCHLSNSQYGFGSCVDFVR